MKNKSVLSICCLSMLSVLSCTFGCIGNGFGKADVKAAVSSEEDKGHSPIFYGATEITIDKDVVDVFDVNDPRFRIFAKDYEDGDLTPSIECVSNDVNPSVSGNYSLSYKVTDSSKNEVSITVPVHVTDNESGNCTIQRTAYCIPAMENMKKTGTERCNTGDRQMLGIYVPTGSSFTFKSLDTDFDVKSEVIFFTDTRSRNSISNNLATDGTTHTLSNSKSGEGLGSVPFLTSPRLSTEECDVTHKYEISFGSDVLPLDYYHYKDDEQAFRTKVKKKQNAFSVIDGEAIMYVVPLADIDKLCTDISTLDGILEYFLDVVDRMDAMIGLSFNPERETDRNYRTKYTAVADGAYAGSGIGAYYAGNFIAVGSYTMYSLCMYTWGNLHELGHGYQGNFGKGTLGGTSLYFNETGNNILAHYIQMDKSLYRKDGDWLGSLSNIEEGYNKERLKGTYIFTNVDGTYTYTHEKLYFIINLLDSFEGEKTYGKLFSYYRSLVLEEGYDKNYSVADIYAMFFADEYKANIVPYLDAWHIDLTPSVERNIVNNPDLEDFIIPYDTLTESELSTYVEGGDNRLKYAPVKSSTLDSYMNDKLATLTITTEIDDFTKLANKTIVIKKKGVIEKSIKITSESLEVDNLPFGDYQIQFPTIIGYESSEMVGLNFYKDESISHSYTKIDISDKSIPFTIKILGVYGTSGFTMSFQDNNTKLRMTLGTANLGNLSMDSSTLFSSVTIVSSSNEELENLQLMGGQYYQDLSFKDGATGANASSTIDIDIGTVITVYNEAAQRVHAYTTINGIETQMGEYDNSQKTKRYKVTEDGIELMDQESFDTKSITYGYAKNDHLTRLETLKEQLTDEILDDKSLSISEKNQFYEAYSLLNEEDRREYDELMARIERGGLPTLSLVGDYVEIKQDQEFVASSYISSITDNEDGNISVDAVTVEGTVDTSTVGTYSIAYTVVDSDGNTDSKTLNVKVVTKDANGVLNMALIVFISCVGVLLLGTFIAVEYMKIHKDN